MLSVYSSQSSSYTTRIELTGKIGYSSKKASRRSMGRLGFVLPIIQKSDSYIGYLTMIGLKDTAKHLEGNIGIGYRSFIAPAWILGEYVFYDVRSTSHNKLLQQATIGIEALSKYLEFRLNGYIPTNKKYSLLDHNIYKANYDSHINSTQVHVQNKRVIEQAVPGFDIEAGGSHPRLSRLELFAAYYYFNGKNVNSVIGGRVRGNINIYSWLSFESEMNYDKERSFVSYFGLRLGWSLGVKQGAMSWSHKKMTQLPIRDIDIISSEREEKKTIMDKIFPGNTILIARGMREKDIIITSGGAIVDSSVEGAIEKLQTAEIQVDNIVDFSISADDHATYGDLENESDMLSLKPLISHDNSINISAGLKNKIRANVNKFVEEDLIDQIQEVNDLRQEVTELQEEIKKKQTVTSTEEVNDLRQEVTELQEEIKKKQTVASTEEVTDLQQEISELQQEVSDQQTVISQLKSRTKSTRKPSKKHRHVLTPRERAEKALKDRARLEILKTKSTPLSMKERIELTNLKQKVGVSVKSNVKSTYSSAGIKSSASVSALKSLRANLSAQNTAKSSAIASGVTGRPSLKDLKLKKKQRARSSMSSSAVSARQGKCPWEFPKRSPFGVKPVTKISIRAGLAKKGIEVRQSGSIDDEIQFYNEYLADPLRPTDKMYSEVGVEALNLAVKRKFNL